MIFSASKWNNTAEIRQFISVSRSMTFAVVESPLRNAFEMFIRPLLGDDMTTDLISYYTAGESADEKQKRLIYLSQRANAFLAFWYDYNEMQMLIDDNGAHRQDGEKVKGPYKYQEQNLRNGWKDKGFSALDDVLKYLEQEVTSFANFKKSENYTLLKKEIVRTTKEVDDVYFINQSRIIFLRLRTHLRTVEQTKIAPKLGSIYDDMITSITGDNPDAKYTKLREMLVPVVVLYAVSRLIIETGSLTDKGLFFETTGNSEDAVISSPVAIERLAVQAKMAEADAMSYWGSVEKYLTKELAYTSAGTSRLPKFNNNNKKSFWS